MDLLCIKAWKQWTIYILKSDTNHFFFNHKSLRVIPTSIFHKTMSSRKAIDEFPVNLHLKFTQVNFYK